MLQDPLPDWLNAHAESRTYITTNIQHQDAPELDFGHFIRAQSDAFESRVVESLSEVNNVVQIARNPGDVRRRDFTERTRRAMESGAAIIYQGVLWDPVRRIYGAPDLLIRSDVHIELFPGSIESESSVLPAPSLPSSNYHYLVIDIKYMTLRLLADGRRLGNSPTNRAYKAQLFLYNDMLGKLQGYTPPQTFLLGRGCVWTSKGEEKRETNAFTRLAAIEQDSELSRGVVLREEVNHALAWLMQLREEGSDWDVLPEPSVRALYPYPSRSDVSLYSSDSDAYAHGSDEDLQADWSGQVRSLAQELGELTLLWYVGPPGRERALDAGISRWDDPRLTPEAVGVTGQARGPILAQILAANHDTSEFVLPGRVLEGREVWDAQDEVVFYVDFEYCSDLKDDFSSFPERGGQPLIFMIGCGHLENEEWKFQSFVADRLTEDEELKIIDSWIQHMAEVSSNLSGNQSSYRVFHWSNAEITALESAHNSARQRHGAYANWPQLDWYDLLKNVMEKQPVGVRGALAYGLKEVANAMHSNGLIDTEWRDSRLDGLGAMVGAWHCDDLAIERDCTLIDIPLMKEIAAYNETDCKVMMEIVQYFRSTA